MTTPYRSDFVPNSTFYRILSGFHRTFATGVACRQGTLTPPDTLSRPFWDLQMFYLLRPILFRTCRYFSRTMLFEYPSVLSRFCYILKAARMLFAQLPNYFLTVVIGNWIEKLAKLNEGNIYQYQYIVMWDSWCLFQCYSKGRLQRVCAHYRSGDRYVWWLFEQRHMWQQRHEGYHYPELLPRLMCLWYRLFG